MSTIDFSKAPFYHVKVDILLFSLLYLLRRRAERIFYVVGDKNFCRFLLRKITLTGQEKKNIFES